MIIIVTTLWLLAAVIVGVLIIGTRLLPFALLGALFGPPGVRPRLPKEEPSNTPEPDPVTEIPQRILEGREWLREQVTREPKWLDYDPGYAPYLLKNSDKAPLHGDWFDKFFWSGVSEELWEQKEHREPGFTAWAVKNQRARVLSGYLLSPTKAANSGRAAQNAR